MSRDTIQAQFDAIPAMDILSIICIFFYLGRSWGQEQTYVVFAPKAFCVDASEKVVIQAHGYTEPFAVSVAIKSYPDKNSIYSLGQVNLSPENKFQGSASLIIKRKDLPGEPNAISYVYLEVICAHFSKTITIPLRYDNGFIFIETDKSIYSSDETSVKVRAYTFDENLKPAQREVILTFIDPEGKETEMVGSTTNPGIVTFRNFYMPFFPKLGLWTINAKYREDFTTTGTTQFEFKKKERQSYVLIEPENNVISYKDLEDFKINIKVSGNIPEGDVFVFFAIKEDLHDDEKEMLLAEIQTTKLVDGVAQISFNTTEEIKKLNISPEDLNNKYLNIFVDVSAEWDPRNMEMLHCAYHIFRVVHIILTGEFHESKITDIKYSISPYTLDLVATPLFLKPGNPFPIKVQVNAPGHVTGGVAVILEGIFDKTLNLGTMESTTNSDGVASFIINIPSDVATLDFHVRTAIPDLPAKYQASKDYEVVAYSSHSHSFLSLSWPDSYKTLFVGKTLNITVTPESPYVDSITHYNYLVSSKGKVVHFGTVKKLPDKSSQLLKLPLTRYMVPTACLLVYYFVTGDQTTELVSDSVCLKIQKKCGNQLQIHLSPNKDVYSPGESLSLTVETQSESWVALSLVDVATYNSEERSKSFVERILQSSHKPGQECGAGGGRNNTEVLCSTGLTVLSNVDTGCSQQDGGSFKKVLRSKRDLKQRIDKIASEYKHPVLQKCCYDGAYQSEESCVKRAARIKIGPNCSRAFSRCCEEANIRRFQNPHMDSGMLHHPGGPTLPRLPEQRLWNVYHVPKSSTVDLTSPWSLTSWEIHGVGVSNNGLCVADVLQGRVSQEQ
ncbi:complement C5-like [Sorex araneus]|uniref:complement C5-like n=1 Tax=Sorex araneus TaxID=42254 RepID=UPI0024336F6E|nr:complement C5-like [Sorex araneus]